MNICWRHWLPSLIKGGQDALGKSSRRLWLETLVYGIVIGVAVSGLRCGVFQALMHNGWQSAASITIMVYLMVIVIVMAILAIYIIIKTREGRERGGRERGGSTSSSSLSTSKDEFANMVAAVAVVYCLCEIPFFVDVFHFAFVTDRISILRIITDFFVVLNSSVNIFIYLAFSRGFRRTFFQLFSRP